MKNYNEIIKNKFESLKSKKDVYVLGIESSCDETAAAVVKNGREILSNVISSQIDIHRRFGGVVPEVASRNHTLAINKVVEDALKEADLSFSDIDAIGVTYGAGLIGALLIGVSAAKAYSYAFNIPLIKVNHIEGHIAANYIEFHDLKPPFLAVVASGGHTSLIAVKGYNEFEVLGGTADDAIGEAFDKVARLVGLPYPGGPNVEKAAISGQCNINFFKNEKQARKDLVLSFSGLKTAVVNYVHNIKQKGEELPVADICASFSKTAVKLLVDAAVYAAAENKFKTIVLAGGVAANSVLRETLKAKAEEKRIQVLFPKMILCTDNAAMIASKAYFSIKEGLDLADLSLNAKSSL